MKASLYDVMSLNLYAVHKLSDGLGQRPRLEPLFFFVTYKTHESNLLFLSITKLQIKNVNSGE